MGPAWLVSRPSMWSAGRDVKGGRDGSRVVRITVAWSPSPRRTGVRVVRSLVELACILSIVAPPCVAGQTAHSSSVLDPRGIDRIVRHELAADAGRLWGRRLDSVPLFLVSGKAVLLGADPGRSGYTPDGSGWWKGALPAGVVPANTSVTWAGRRWAMVLLPLPTDSLAAERLLVHERWHVIQPAVLPIPAYDQFGPGAALLEHPDGRTWLRLEWRALAQALAAPPRSAAASAAVRDALIFRARRYALADSAERTRERLLDLTEGMAEYTAWKLTESPATALEHAVRVTAPALETYARAFPYYTGPAYGYLLDRRAPGWIPRLRTTLDLQTLLAGTLGRDHEEIAAWLHGRGAPSALTRAAERAAERYGLRAVRKAEQARWQAHERMLAELRARFVDGPTVRIDPGAVRVSFDPTRTTSLDSAGTVYGNLEWKGAGGAVLSAPGGALIAPDWSEIRIPVDTARFTAGTLVREQRWLGAGWSLTLPAGWVIRAEGTSWVVTPP